MCGSTTIRNAAVGAGIFVASAKSTGDDPVCAFLDLLRIFGAQKKAMATPLEEAKRIYLEQIPKLQQLNDQIKQVRKIIGTQKRVFKKHMKQNNLPQLRVGTTMFGFEKKEKIVCTMDRVEKSFPNDQVLKFKEQNKQAKEVFTEL